MQVFFLIFVRLWVFVAEDEVNLNEIQLRSLLQDNHGNQPLFLGR